MSRTMFDWTSLNPPPNLTPFQKFTRDVDWESSPLGPMAQWPAQLRQTVLMIIADPSPAVVYWGDDQTIVYNEAYVPLIGQKHPGLQGQDPKIGFAEIWDHFDGVLKHGQQTGETIVEAGAFLLLYRHGYLEETYFSWKFVPMIGEEGFVVGSYATVVEVTREIIFERRIATTEAIGMQMATAKTMHDLCSRILRGLEHNPKDVPFAAVYSVQDTSAEVRIGSPTRSSTNLICSLQGTLGIEEGHALAPQRIDLMQADNGLAAHFRDALYAGTPVLLSTRSGSLPVELLKDVEWRGFGVPCDKAVICPIRSSSGNVRVFLLIGLNPRRPYDPDYQKFISLLAEQVTKPHVQSVLFAEELRIGADLAKQAAVDRAELSQQLKLRTEQFERSQLRLSRFAERAAVGLAIHDAAGDVLYANQKWYDLTSREGDDGDLLIVPWEETFASSDRKIAEEMWHRLIFDKSPVKFQARFGSLSTSASNGAVHNMRQLGVSVLCTAYPDHGEDGSVKSIMTCVTDVSDLVWTENQLLLRTLELEQSQNKWRRFADRAPIGLCILTVDGHLDFANAAWYDMTSSATLEHKTGCWLDVIHPDDITKVKLMLDELKSTQGPLTIETRLNSLWTSQHGPESKLNIANTAAFVLCSSYAEKNTDGFVQEIVLWMTEISAQKAAEHFLRKRMDEALEMKRQQENFIDMTSHEIRNPLSAILQCTDDLSSTLRTLQHLNGDPLNSSEDLFKNALESVETIALCCTHQKSIVDDILTLSKLDSNLLEISPVSVQPRIIMKKLLQMFSAELQAKDIRVELHMAESIADIGIDWVQLDPSRLLQVLINLLTNAIKFTASQSNRFIKLSFGASLQPPTDILCAHEDFVYFSGVKKDIDKTEKFGKGEVVYLHFSVQDTGQGLTTEETSVLFKRFSQASPRTYSQYGGSGLGLFISRQLVELQGGEIGVASVAGVGSTFAFYIMTRKAGDQAGTSSASVIRSAMRRLSSSGTTEKLLPQLDRDHKKVSPDVGKMQQQQSEMKSLNILLVEDNLINQTVVKKQLVKASHTVHVANHGMEALEFLSKSKSWVGNEADGHDLDVVLMDIEMPVMDGLTCAQEIRRLEQHGKLRGHLPIIAVTANARTMQMNMAKESGMDDVVTKPFRVPALVSQIQELLGKLGFESCDNECR